MCIYHITYFVFTVITHFITLTLHQWNHKTKCLTLSAANIASLSLNSGNTWPTRKEKKNRPVKHTVQYDTSSALTDIIHNKCCVIQCTMFLNIAWDSLKYCLNCIYITNVCVFLTFHLKTGLGNIYLGNDTFRAPEASFQASLMGNKIK